MTNKECKHCYGNGYIIITTKGSSLTEDLLGIKEDPMDCDYCEGTGYENGLE